MIDDRFSNYKYFKNQKISFVLFLFFLIDRCLTFIVVSRLNSRFIRKFIDNLAISKSQTIINFSHGIRDITKNCYKQH